MIIQTEESLLNVRIVYSLVVRQETVSKVLIPWSWKKPLTPPFVDTTSHWRLDMDYLGEDERRYTMSWTGGRKSDITNLKADIVSQLAAQDGKVMDRAFEDAIANLKR